MGQDTAVVTAVPARPRSRILAGIPASSAWRKSLWKWQKSPKVRLKMEKSGWNSTGTTPESSDLGAPQTLSPSRPTGAGIRHGELKRQQWKPQKSGPKGTFLSSLHPEPKAKKNAVPVANSSSLEKQNNYSKIRIWHIQNLEIRDSDWIHCQAGWAPLS